VRAIPVFSLSFAGPFGLSTGTIAAEPHRGKSCGEGARRLRRNSEVNDPEGT
jgi:hypothetical protein